MAGSKVEEVQAPPPLIGTPGTFFHVELSSGRSALRPANRIALGLGHEEEFPDDLAGLGVERVHAPLHALEVAAGDADEDKAVPGDRRGRHDFALLGVGDRGLPEPLAGLEIVGQHRPSSVPRKKHAIQVGRAPVGRQNVGWRVHVRAPIHGAIGRVEREDIEFGGADQGALRP